MPIAEAVLTDGIVTTILEKSADTESAVTYTLTPELGVMMQIPLGPPEGRPVAVGFE